MEIRIVTISFSKGRSKTINTREKEIKRLLAELDRIICNSDDLQGIEMELKNYDNLKRELEGNYDHQFTQNIEIPQLTEENKAELEGLLTLEECKEALASFGNGKSPGEDGFTVLIF